jgi:hypothetical protein
MTAAVRFVIGTVLAVLLSALFPVEVHAQKVALLHADLDARAQIVRAKLVAAGLTDVTVIDVSINPTGTTPTLAQLQQYHAIFTYSMFGYLNRDVLGVRCRRAQSRRPVGKRAVFGIHVRCRNALRR